MSSASTFDPSREWLGLDAVDLADPRLVLGLSSGQLDSETIIKAADERLARLRGLDPGPFTVARTALVKRVEESRDGLLASLPARPGSSFSPPPPPGAVARPASPAAPAARRPPTAAPDRTPPPPPVPPPAAAARSVEQPLVPAAAELASAGGGPRTARTRRSPWLLTLVTLAAAAAAGIAFRGQLLSHRDRLIALARDQAEQIGEAIAPPATPAAKPAPGAAPRLPLGTPQNRPRMVEEQPPVSAPGPSGETPPAPTSPPTPEPISVTVPRPPSQPANPPLPAVVPEPDSPAPRPRSPRPAATDAGRLDDFLAGARAALAAEDFARADDWLARARDAVGDGPDGDRVAAWEQLAAHARQFASFRGKALKAGMGSDFDVGKDRISIVEVNDRMFIFRHHGRNIRLPIDEVPEAIAMTMTKQWFAGGGHAANHLFIGARYLTRPEPDPAAARNAWQSAQRGGEDVSLVMTLLEDPLLRGPSQRR
jgi:outer membrane biosynthesis protein TonB